MLTDRHYKKKLDVIRDHIGNRWDENEGLPVQYTLHGASHCENVEKAIYKLIPGSKYSEFSDEEKFYLLSSAWLHDVGMIPDLFDRKSDYRDSRHKHHLRSIRYIEENRQQLGLSHSEARVVSEICKYHTKSEDMMRCKKLYGKVRLQLLASYLRLADAIHIDTTRVDVSLFKIFLELGMRWESKYHWLKSFWIQDVFPDFDTLTITIQLKISRDDDKHVDVIANMIEEEVRTELHTVKDILIRGGISYFLDVKTKYGLGIDARQRIDLKQVIGNTQLALKPSATDVMGTIIDTILPILNFPDKRQAYSIIRTYQGELIKDIVENRPCHVLVSKIYRLIEKHVKEDEKDLSEGQIDSRTDSLKSDINQFKRSRDGNLTNLLSFTKAILASEDSILLFGYSNLVINALKAAGDEAKEKSKIYVCECAGKTQFNEMNDLIYCDGIEYASKIRDVGYREVSLVPDILVGNLISRGLVSKIIFGANGVDIESGTFGHTAGHLAIADLAHLYHIPVFVIVDSDKFGDMNHNEKLERKTNWVTGDKKALSKLEGITLFNPKEDLVDADKVYALVTDYGIFPADKIPDTIRRKVGKS